MFGKGVSEASSRRISCLRNTSKGNPTMLPDALGMLFGVQEEKISFNGSLVHRTESLKTVPFDREGAVPQVAEEFENVVGVIVELSRPLAQYF